MLIEQLKVQDLRIIETLTLSPGAGINFIIGGNGAGKTSLLEAIYLASRGRTFRHPMAGPLIRRGADDAVVVVRFRDEPGAAVSRVLGVRRGRRDFAFRLDGQDVTKRSVLADNLPIQWIGSQPQHLIDQGPQVRRRFVDMGLFHVEHDFLPVMSAAARALRQRNAALRNGNAASVVAWDEPLVNAANRLDDQRRHFVEVLLRTATQLLNEWNVGFDLAYRYRRGWADDEHLADLLAARLESDLKQGYTSLGPQRADVELRSSGIIAERILSRGQQKLLVMALNLALAEVMASKVGKIAVLLIDDLAAEFDVQNQEIVLEALAKRPNQVFVTAIERPAAAPCLDSSLMFHVEHGRLVTLPRQT